MFLGGIQNPFNLQGTTRIISIFITIIAAIDNESTQFNILDGKRVVLGKMFALRHDGSTSQVIGITLDRTCFLTIHKFIITVRLHDLQSTLGYILD